MKTNEQTFHGRLAAAVETLSEISEWLVNHAAVLGMSRMVLQSAFASGLAPYP